MDYAGVSNHGGPQHCEHLETDALCPHDAVCDKTADGAKRFRNPAVTTTERDPRTDAELALDAQPEGICEDCPRIAEAAFDRILADRERLAAEVEKRRDELDDAENECERLREGIAQSAADLRKWMDGTSHILVPRAVLEAARRACVPTIEDDCADDVLDRVRDALDDILREDGNTSEPSDEACPNEAICATVAHLCRECDGSTPEPKPSEAGR
jgi:hypothetical protein